MTDETRYGRGSRRRFLSVAGGTLLAGTSLGAAQQTTTPTAQPVQRYRFGGEVQAWQGRAPQSIQGQSNPTLQLSVGQVYEVTWENLDGQPHNFALQNEDGQNLEVIFPNVQAGTAGQGTTPGTTATGTPTTTEETVTPPDDAIDVTETIAEQGATQTLQFVVTPDVAQYICTIHPTTMVGDVETQGDGGGGGNGGNGGQGNGNGGRGGGGGQGNGNGGMGGGGGQGNGNGGMGGGNGHGPGGGGGNGMDGGGGGGNGMDGGGGDNGHGMGGGDGNGMDGGGGGGGGY
ncbi:plastocyanin/azurin family copper-binding protein [Halomicrococcus gelatinilyticus]|uniref:plastocyanin/azurin family copper-binding protein n=1 Tax=Halomicrococcus gelatinilyticus TaxID=1702103 RepID=UPI002E0DF010